VLCEAVFGKILRIFLVRVSLGVMEGRLIKTEGVLVEGSPYIMLKIKPQIMTLVLLMFKPLVIMEAGVVIGAPLVQSI